MTFRQFTLQLRLLLLVALSLRTGRAAKLDGIRSRWGRGSHRTYEFGAIASSHASRLAISPSRHSLDNRTWHDLNLDDVFVAIDHTTSTLGQHALYHRLRTLPAAPYDNTEFEALTTLVANDPSVREDAQLAVSHLQDTHGYDVWWLAQSDATQPRRWYVVFPLLSLTAAVAIIAAPYWPWALLVLLLNVVVRYSTDAHIFAVAGCFRQFAPLIAAAESIARVRGLPDPPATLRQLQEDAPSLATLKWISRWTGGNPFMLSLNANQWAIAASDFVNAIYEYFNLLVMLDATGVFVGVKLLQKQQPAFLRMVAAVGELDAAIGVASYRTSRNDWTRPHFLPAQSPATFQELCHPLVKHAVPNSIAIDPGHGVLVTGSNMAGKSTFLRTVGVNAVLAQTVNTCIATRYAAPRFVLRSCISRADDLLAGKSCYMVEVEAVIDLLNASNSHDNHLFLLDELFRGTNAVERVAAAHAVLEELIGSTTASKAHCVIAATHDGELVGMLQSYGAFHFTDTLGPKGLEFDYKLRAGVAKSRTAIALLRLHGAPAAMIEKALKTATRMDRERSGPDRYFRET